MSNLQTYKGLYIEWKKSHAKVQKELYTASLVLGKKYKIEDWTEANTKFSTEDYQYINKLSQLVKTADNNVCKYGRLAIRQGDINSSQEENDELNNFRNLV